MTYSKLVLVADRALDILELADVARKESVHG